MSKSPEINKALKILNLSKESTLSELEKAFRKLALRYHPDRCKEDKKLKCKEKFIEINKARKIIEDYHMNKYKPSSRKEMKRKIKKYKERIKEYKKHIRRFYDDWFGGVDFQ